MREQIKQQLRDMIVTLGRAEAILDSKSKKKEEDEVKQLLEDMQASAIAMGSVIEEEEGLETLTVERLEEYCDLLWQYLIAEELKERFRLCRTLAGKRSEIAAVLEEEIEGRTEVVFLLCRADRWKLMEGIWRTAGENPVYDCRVVVSPYTQYEKGMAAAQDELCMFPAGAEAISYEAYNIEEMKPDLVFVDGPYEAAGEAGRAGTVPDYDFEAVRKSAEVVVYLPVYEEGAEVQEGDCMTDRVREADLVIVPSEEIKDVYKRTLCGTENAQEIIKKVRVSASGNITKLAEGLRAQR